MVAASRASLVSVVALSVGSATGLGETVTLHRAGFPERWANKRPACGERTATKSLLSPEYWSHVIFGGFRQGSCADAGFPHFEKTETVSEGGMLPWERAQSIKFEIFSRDADAIDAVACVARSCEPEMAAIVHSNYTREAVGCVGPAFGPCASKAWACLGDGRCRDAVKCVPKVAAQCGVDLMRMLSDSTEREKIMCIQECKGSKVCVLAKCGKEAVSCLLGSDKLCHDVIHCVSAGIATCSVGAARCLLSWEDGICRDNVKCLAAGVNSCADPAINALTDLSIANLVLCANEKCPAVTSLPELTPELASSAIVAFKLPEYPKQLACMGYECTGKLFSLLADRDVRALTGCLPEAVEACGPAVWECAGEEKCFADFRCWTEGFADVSEDVWAMLTESQERDFDEALVTCMEDCIKDDGLIVKTACLVGKCGLKAAGCLADGGCRKLLMDIPVVAGRCGLGSLRDMMARNSTFSRAVHCGARVVGRCGSEAVELIRDTNIASLVQCNSQCTHAPALTEQELVVV